MRKIFTTACMLIAAMAASAQDVTNVTLDFNQNPWNYPVSEVTKGWQPDYTDLTTPGGILDEKDFSWPIPDGSSEKIKMTVYPVDLDEYNKISVYASYEIDAAEAAGLYTTPGKKNLLYTQSGTKIRFESPTGYKFSKMIFHCYRNSNILVGDEYEEEFEYEYNGSTFKQKLKVWYPTSPLKNQYGYNIWDGDEKNALFVYPFFNVCFVKVDISLVPDGSAGIANVKTTATQADKVVTLDGRRAADSKPLSKGIYIVNGKKVVIN